MEKLNDWNLSLVYLKRQVFRDATPEEIIAWCLVRCIDEKDKLCVNGCDKCQIADIGYCAGIDEEECWRIIENKKHCFGGCQMTDEHIFHLEGITKFIGTTSGLWCSRKQKMSHIV